MYILELFEDFEKTYDPYYEIYGTDFDAEKVADYIKHNCKPWLSLTEGGRLTAFRGTRTGDNGETPIFIKNVRSERSPKDSSLEAQHIFNDLVASVGGTANRSNSIFCTGSYAQAAGYGPVYAVFPIGDFSYTWCPLWSDFYEASRHKLGSLIHKRTGNQAALSSSIPDTIELFYKTFKNSRQDLNDMFRCDEGLDIAIEDCKEIMVACKSAVYVKYNMYYDFVAPILVGEGE